MILLSFSVRTDLAFLGSSRPFPEASVLLPEDDDAAGAAAAAAAAEDEDCCCCSCLLLVAFRMDSSLASSLSDAIVGTLGKPRLGSITKSGCSVWH